MSSATLNEVPPWVQLQWLLWSNSRTVVTSHAHIAYTFNPGLRGQNNQPVERKVSLQSHFLHQERLGSSPRFPRWYTAPKQRLTRKFLSGHLKQEFSQQIFSNNLFKLKYVISYAGIQCYQGSSAPWEKAAALYRSISSTFHGISSSSAFFVSYLQRFEAIPGQSLCDLLAQLSKIAGNKSKANYSLLAPGLLDPRMGRLQDNQQSRKLGRNRKNSIPQGRTVEFWSRFGDLGKASKIFKGCWHHEQQLKFFLRTVH